MSHFYASIQGSRGEATRTGSKASGIVGHVRGWNIGCRVYASVNENGEDCVTVSLTGGSNSSCGPYDLGTFTRADLQTLFHK